METYFSTILIKFIIYYKVSEMYSRMIIITNLPNMKKFPGKVSSEILLYVKSNTSSIGNEPNPRGKVSRRFILQNKK